MFSNTVTDRPEFNVYVDKNFILSHLTQEEIFKIVFGYLPVEFEYVTSPFRHDSNPGCWFEYKENKLIFVDWADRRTLNGIRMGHLDCFNAIQLYFKFPNFSTTLNYLYTLIKNKKDFFPVKKSLIDSDKQEPHIKKRKNKSVKIMFLSRNFNLQDKEFWSRYEISSSNLNEDGVYAVLKYRMTNTKIGDYDASTLYELCYAYTDFPDSRKKLYFPNRVKGKKRFITNCKSDDVGGYKKLPKSGELLVISKSYKDYRVLKNQGLTVCWFQNEGMIPSEEILIDLLSRFKEIVVFFDNDEAGKIASVEVVKALRKLSQETLIRRVYLPNSLLKENITDPSDLIYKKGKVHLLVFLYKKKLL